MRSCYRTVFGLAEEKKIESLAIPLLASGSYGFPKGVALRIALSEIESFMKAKDIDLYLVVFDEKAFALSTELYGDIDEYINSNYVEEQTIHEYSQPTEEWVFAASSMEEKPAKKKGFIDRLISRDKSNRADACLEDPDLEIPVVTCGAPMPTRSLDDVVKNLDKTFMEMVFSFADAKEMTDVEVQKKANLDRKAFSKLKCGTTKNPSKSTALALAIALELNLDETRDLLSRAGLALSPCSRQDLIVQYFIEREAYDIYEINIALFEHGEPGLGSLAKE
ncbi:MAG: RNase III inhibitor [Lachnospiraceae bacterium]|nr:RNase III inhibitor [Lachnospiraceae bacterium]